MTNDTKDTQQKGPQPQGPQKGDLNANEQKAHEDEVAGRHQNDGQKGHEGANKGPHRN
ncbi:hypothetical protein [Massilia glaciei]|uniref:hypothetical protein n=1 Tax=Massilia glaciei TaxID=1524097 RepID=UPI0015E7F39D|nr:hypothetical protein [Massilia glaciei]